MRKRGIITLAISCVVSVLYGQNFSKVSTASFETMSKAKSEWVDFDNDGFLDLFVAGTNGSGTHKVVVYYNNGDGTFNSLTLANWTNVGYDFGDYNNDQYIDMIICGNDASSTPQMSVFENVSGSSFTQKTLGLTAITRGGVAWEDFDLDGDLDIVASGLNDSNDPIALIYELNGSSYMAHSTNIGGLSNGDLIVLDANGDGLKEVMITGFDDGGDLETSIYTINKDFSIGDYQTTLDAYGLNRLAFGDYNEDGAADIAITGYTDASAESSDLLKNNSSNSFTLVSSFLDDLDNSSVEFGDLNNDGLLDIVLMGTDDTNDKHFYYYKNSATYAYASSSISVEKIYNGDAAIGDYDNDGDLDLFQVGNSTLAMQANLYASDMSGTTINNAPSVPTGLSYSSNQDSVILSWTASSDGLTDANSLTYAVYLSASASTSDLIITPLSDISSGFRKSAKPGNVGYQTTKALYNLPEGTYYWSVQAIDNGQKGSAFASEESFGVCYKVSLGNDTTICKNEEITFEITDASATVVNWYTKNDGLKVSNSRTYDHQAFEKDTVIVEITKSYGCTVYDTLIVDVYDLPEFNLGADTAICYSEQLTLAVSGLGIVGLDSVNWYSPGDGALLLDNEKLIFEVLKKDTLIAEIFNVNGCVSYDSIIVDVFDLPVFDLGSDTTICYAEIFEVSVSGLGVIGLDSVNWYSVRQGVLSTDKEDLSFEVLEKDTLVAEVFNVNGCVAYDSLIVDVYDLPVFDLGSDTTICYAENVTFTVSDLGIIGLDSVNWYSVGKGALLLDSESVTIQVFEKDTIIAEVFNANGCVNYDSIIVGVFNPATFSLGNDTTICFGENYTLNINDFSISGLDQVNWYSTGLGSLAEDSEELIFEVLTKDTIVAEVVNTSGCVSYDSLIVDVYPLPSFNLGNDTTICYAESVTFSVSDLGITGLDSVNWYSTVRDSALIVNSVAVTYFTFEKDTLVAEVFNINGCVNYDSLIVDVYLLPAFDLGNDTTICYAESVTFSVTDLEIDGLDSVNWYSALQGSLLEGSESLTFEVLEKDTVIAEVFNVNGCVNYDSLIVNVYDLPSFNLGHDTTICYAENVTFSVSDLGIIGLDSVNWYSTLQGSLLENSESLTFEVFEKDTVIAEVFNLNGCVNYDSLIVDVFALPFFNLGNDTTICFAESVSFSVSDLSIDGLDSVNWYSIVRDSALIVNSEAVTYFTFEKDTLVAEVFNVNGCVSYDSLIVDVYELPVFDLGNDTTICYAESVTFSVSDLGIAGLDSVNWFSLVRDSALIVNNETVTYFTFEKDTLVAEVFNMNGCVYYDSMIVDVFALPDFNIGKDTSICYTETISLRTGAFYAEVNWYSKNTGDTLEQDSWFFNYEVLKTDTIIAEVYNSNGCVNYDTIIIAMDPLPVFDLGEDPSVCFGDSLQLSVDGAWEEINWYTIGDQLLEGNNPSYQFKVIEDIQLWAEVWTSKGCVQYDTVEVSVLPLPEFDLPSQLVYCYSDSISVDVAVEAENFLWTNSAHTLLSDESNWKSIATQSDSVWVTLESSEGCFYKDSMKLQVNALPEYDILGADVLCVEESTDLTTSYEESMIIAWYIDADTLSRDTLFNYLPTSTTTVNTLLRDENGCVTIKSLEVTVNPRPEIFAGNDTLICHGESIQLGQTAVTGHSYSWNNGASLSGTDVSNPVASPIAPTTYILEEVNEFGCNRFDSIYVEVNPNIVIEAGPDQAICLGDSVVIGGQPTANGSQFDYAYSWTPLANIHNPATANPSVFPEVTTWYYVEVKSHRCMVEYDSVLVTVNYQPEVEVSPQQSVGPDQSVILEAYGGVEYAWEPENTLDNPESQFPTAAPVETTLYTVKVTDENGCVTYETVNVLVQNVIFIPNLFTPNGDGSNDAFMIYGSGIANITFAVFDLNGNQVYFTSDITQASEIGWDGTYHGQELPNGTYLWSIGGQFHNGSPLTFEGRSKGTIKLLR